MIRKWSKKISQNQHKIRESGSLKIFGDLLHRKELWNLNRSTVSKGVSIGLFWAFIPVPFQMVFSTLFALYFRGNVAISVSMVWITNPLTMPPIFYLCYKFGAAILHREEVPFHFEASFDWMCAQFDTLVVPLFLGSFIIACTLSFVGYFLIRYMWFHSTKKDARSKNRSFRIFDKTKK